MDTHTATIINKETIQNSIKNTITNNFTTTNADEIFQILSQKIAKYCQILSDLTNCEVFFKSNLNNSRSLYWGTYKMMFNYTHQGLQFDRNDSLIKIGGRSMTSDIANIVEELLNVENLESSSKSDRPSSCSFVNETINEEKSSVMVTNVVEQNENIELKECVVFMDRLDEQLYEQYLEKFEKSRAFVDDELLVDRMFSNLNRSNNHETKMQTDNKLEIEEDEEEEEQEDESFICEMCHQYTFKHMPELKLHILKEHEKIPFQTSTHAPFQCTKCNNQLNTLSDYVNHVLLCYYPDLYSCKMCQQDFNTYSEYYYHKRYVHDTVYACTLCQRRFKDAENLMEHDQIMHSKTPNFCEICFEATNTRKELQHHYKEKHLVYQNTINNNNSNRINDITNYEKITAYKPQLPNNDLNSGDQIFLLHSGDLTNKQSKTAIDTTTSGEHSHNSLLTSAMDNDSSNSSSRANNEENNNDSDDLGGYPKVENKMQKSELIRGLLDRKHQCKWCAQRFYTKSQLRQHESTHTNTVLFCPVCDKEFTHKDRLTGHMKCHMEPSLECKVCGKKFKRLCNLYNHELVHGLTEHAFMLCQFCGRGFRSRRDYQNHVIANHRDQLMKSEIIKNSNSNNSILNETFNNVSAKSSSSSILGEELQKPNNIVSDKNSFYSPSKNRIDDNNYENSFIDTHLDKNNKKSKLNHANNHNTQLLVKAAEFVDNSIRITNNSHSSSSTSS